MTATDAYTGWAPWHPEHGFQDAFMSATWVSTDLDEIAQRVKRLNQDDKTNSRTGWRAVKITLSLAGSPAQAAWQPIETAPKNIKLLLWSPGYKISDDPDEPPQFCVSTTRDWCWATHWMPHPPLPASPVPSAKPLCSCKASARDGQHMAWCPAVTSTDGK